MFEEVVLLLQPRQMISLHRELKLLVFELLFPLGLLKNTLIGNEKDYNLQLGCHYGPNPLIILVQQEPHAGHQGQQLHQD